MIRHSVVFNLIHPHGSPEEQKFLEDACILARIPGVQNFERLRQTSPKTDFSFGFFMAFENQQAYEDYNNHPLHVAFVRDRWVSEVRDFMELDYEKL